MSTLRVFALALLWTLLSLPASAGGADPIALSQYQLQVPGGVTLAGKLDPEALATLDAERTLIIDLRTPAEGTDAEAEAAARLGLAYRNLPVAGASIDPAQVDELAGLLAANAGRDVILHCASGNRAGMLWSAVQLHAGMPLDEVLQDVSAIVDKEGPLNAVRSYAEAQAAEHAPAAGGSAVDSDR